MQQAEEESDFLAILPPEMLVELLSTLHLRSLFRLSMCSRANNERVSYFLQSTCSIRISCYPSAKWIYSAIEKLLQTTKNIRKVICDSWTLNICAEAFAAHVLLHLSGGDSDIPVVADTLIGRMGVARITQAKQVSLVSQELSVLELYSVNATQVLQLPPSLTSLTLHSCRCKLELKSHSAIRDIRVIGGAVDNTIASLHLATNLQSLQLTGEDSVILSYLTAICPLSLEYLRVYPWTITEDVKAALRNCIEGASKLRSLDVNGDITAVANIFKPLPAITRFRLVQFGPRDVSRIFRAVQFPGLVSLSLEDIDQHISFSGASIIATLRNIELNINEELDTRLLAWVYKHTQLHSLSVTARGSIKIDFPELQVLRCVGMEEIEVCIVNAPQLHDLYLTRTSVSMNYHACPNLTIVHASVWGLRESCYAVQSITSHVCCLEIGPELTDVARLLSYFNDQPFSIVIFNLDKRSTTTPHFLLELFHQLQKQEPLNYHWVESIGWKLPPSRSLYALNLYIIEEGLILASDSKRFCPSGCNASPLTNYQRSLVISSKFDVSPKIKWRPNEHTKKDTSEVEGKMPIKNESANEVTRLPVSKSRNPPKGCSLS